MTLSDGLKEYFRKSGFDEKTYTDDWVKIPLIGPIAFYFPNWAERKKVVRFHDLHHVLTEYPTSLLGEGLIGAWELGSGCSHLLPGLILNSLAMPLGFLMSPRQVFHAFVRGRNCKNLYHNLNYTETLRLDVIETRKNLNLLAPIPSAKAIDTVWFLFFLFFGAVESLILLAVSMIPFAIVVGFYLGRSK